MRHLWVVVVLAVALLAPSSARATGRFPASSAVVFHPNDAKTIIVRATFGLLVTRDGGVTWRWICEKAIGSSGAEDPTYVVTPKGTLVGGTSAGLAVSRDMGCTFAFAGGRDTHIVSDLAMRPDGEIVGIQSVPSKAGTLYDNHLVGSKDDAQTFVASMSAIDPTLAVKSIKIAASDPARLYVSAVRGEGDKSSAAFLVSYDAGMSWVERKLELAPGETVPFIANVDPKNADRVYVRTAAAVDARTRLLVTDDAGKTWKKIFESGSPILGVAMSEDGSRLFAGAREGVSSSPTDTVAFSKGSSAEIQCLGMTGSMLWACSTERSGFVVGTSRNGGKSFDAKLHFEDIKGPLECPPESSVAKECTAEWPKLRRELGLPEIGDNPRSSDPGGPALRGRGQRGTRRSRSGFAAFAGIALLGLAGYTILKRLRRR